MKTSIPHKLAVFGIILNSFVNSLLNSTGCYGKFIAYITKKKQNNSYQKEIISDDL